jgi:hypothetical protein
LEIANHYWICRWNKLKSRISLSFSKKDWEHQTTRICWMSWLLWDYSWAIFFHEERFKDICHREKNFQVTKRKLKKWFSLKIKFGACSKSVSWG